ncbi:MAG: phenylalanine--tRNA ligase subunit alpha [Candidatus Diapherotrites archaeon]|nr:phenylalanine--tRNA ligase subunit alpha [Candidatus Diapherotrites archaeon]
MTLENALEVLENREKQILLALGKKDGLQVEDIAKETKEKADSVRHDVARLKELGLVKIEEETKTIYEVSKEGEKVIKEGMLESMLIDKVGKGQVKTLSQEWNVAIGHAKRRDWITLDNGIIKLTPKGKSAIGKETEEEKVLKIIKAKKICYENDLKKTEKEIIPTLKKRGNLIIEKKENIHTAYLTANGKNAVKKGLKTENTINLLTPELIRGGDWKKTKFRSYNVEAPVPPLWGGRKHPLRHIIKMIEEVFVEMGFSEMKGPWVETAFWCMDSMWIPQDHPAREVQDTFYLPGKGKLPDKKLVAAVKEVQENGGNTGSTGYQTPWKPEIAEKLLLRTHTTATTFRQFGIEKIKPPAKMFCIDRIFRNETTDKTHLPEFHQVEGFVMDDSINFRHLLGLLKEFYAKLGVKRLRFKPYYNPYTEPSIEIFGWSDQLNRWIEVGNSGQFRPESLAPYGINANVVAWGLGLERIAMQVYELTDIRELLGHTSNFEWLRTYKIPRRQI